MTKKKPAEKPKEKSAFALRLQAWRKFKGLTQDQAAELLKIKPWSIRDWEQGRHDPLLSSVENVIKRLTKDGY